MRHMVLVADDDESIRDLLVMVLVEAGYATLDAANGQDAVELALEHRPDLALLDVMMPVMDGFAACRAIKADPRTTGIPVFLLTALAHTDSKVRGLGDGATDYITKPFENAELLARIKKVLREKDQRDALTSEVWSLRSLLAIITQNRGRPMEKTARIRVFVASPSDVQEERDQLRTVIDELNRLIGDEKGVVLELVRWETHVAPDMGRPQEVINRQVGPYDIFIGIMWKRFGTPTGHADSGTHEEFTAAFESWQVTRRPRIMFYFSQAPYTLRSPEDVDQLRRVLAFRAQMEKQALVWEYNGATAFPPFAREHLTRAIKDLLAADGM